MERDSDATAPADPGGEDESAGPSRGDDFLSEPENAPPDAGDEGPGHIPAPLPPD